MKLEVIIPKTMGGGKDIYSLPSGYDRMYWQVKNGCLYVGAVKNKGIGNIEELAIYAPGHWGKVTENAA